MNSVSSSPERRISELAIELPPARRAGGNYIPVKIAGGLAYVAGQVSRIGDDDFYKGRVGDTVSREEAQAAARICALNMLSQLRHELGSLDRVKGCVKLLGFVNAVEHYEDHATILNGASDLMTEVFGHEGQHARSAVGAGSLPKNFSVEVEGIFELTSEDSPARSPIRPATRP